MSQPEINPLEDWASEELSEAELDALAGGQSSLDSSLLTFGAVSTPPVDSKIDSSYSSYFGTNGTTSASLSRGIPFNITSKFP